MNRNERIFTKREIILFSIISLFFSIVLLINFLENETSIREIINLIHAYFFLFIPSILAILLNLIFKLANIQNKIIIKITNIISSIFITGYLLLVGGIATI